MYLCHIMGIEIERKFLLKSSDWKLLEQHIKPAVIRQGYLSSDPERTVRVRIKDQEGFLTIKGVTYGLSRKEFEYVIPASEAEDLLQMCDGPLIEKTRYYIKIGTQLWEIDEFFGDNAGLVLAEAELESENQDLPIPDWVGAEVTKDKRYYNSQLAFNPYIQWE